MAEEARDGELVEELTPPEELIEVPVEELMDGPVEELAKEPAPPEFAEELAPSGGGLVEELAEELVPPECVEELAPPKRAEEPAEGPATELAGDLAEEPA